MKNNKPYKKYRPSEIDWLGDIPEHWEVKRIKYIFKEQDKRSEEGLEDLLSVSHYTGVTKKSDRYKEGEEISNAKSLVGYKIVSEGDLVMNIMLAWNGSLGISKFNGITSPAYCVFKSLIGGERYFGYLFRTKNAQQEFKKQSTGIIESRLRLYPDKFFNIKTVVPPKEEQEKIADFLDYKTAKIDRFIRKKKQLIKLLNEQKAGIINQAVTKGLDANVKMKPSGIEWLGEIPEHWEVKKLKGICNAFGRIGFRGYKTTDLVNQGEGAITISPSNMKYDFMTFEKSTYLSWEKYEESPEIKIFNDDIIMVKTGSTYGKVGIVKNLEHEATINPQLLVLKNVTINPNYLYLLLKSNLIQSQVKAEVIGSTIPTISQTKILNFNLVTPPNEEIQSILIYIEKETTILDKTIATIEKEIALVQEYRAALIAEAVTGKIDIRNYEIPILDEEEAYEDLEENLEEELDMVAEDGETMEIE